MQDLVTTSRRERRKYALYPIHDEESAIKADNHGLPQDCRRTRPYQRAHRFDEIIPRLKIFSKPRAI